MVDLVIGVGNEIRGDDRAGLAVIDALAGTGSAALLMRSDGDPLEMIDAWQGLSSVILVDAVSSGSSPGTIHRIDVGEGPLPTMVASRSTHLFGIGEAVELARTLDRLPPSLILFGIEGSRFAPGSDMSPPVVESVATVVEELASLLEGAHA